MNSELRYSATPMTMGSLALLASLASSAGGENFVWPSIERPAFVRDGQNGTFGQTTTGLTVQPLNRNDFFAQMAAVYALLSEGQEPLGEVFETIWDANIEELYEA